MKLNQFFVTFIISFIIVFSLSAISSIFSSNETNGEWYASIRPSITPPNFVFPIVWTILYLLIVISFSLAYINIKKVHKKKLVYLFLLNIAINSLWTFFYFSLKNPVLALLDIILLEISIFYIIFFCWNKYRLTSYLSIPYLLWVSFATILNILTIIK